MKKLLVIGLLLAGLFVGRIEAANDTIAIIEPAPYFRGQTIHVVTSPLHGVDAQMIFCAQTSHPTGYTYNDAQVSGIYVLDSPLWVAGEVSFCRAIIWNGKQQHGGVVKAQVDFIVQP